MDLLVGRGGFDYIENELSAHLRKRGVAQALISTLNPADEIAAIDLVNGATLFLDHVLRIEGSEDIEAARRQIETGTFRLRNLPVWEAGAWMPFEVPEPAQLDDDPTFFVGSCPVLLRELNDIAARTSFPITLPPKHYREMREDMSGFMQSRNLDLSNEEIVRWVWCGLRDGAEMAIGQNAVLCAVPD